MKDLRQGFNVNKLLSKLDFFSPKHYNSITDFSNLPSCQKLDRLRAYALPNKPCVEHSLVICRLNLGFYRYVEFTR